MKRGILLLLFTGYFGEQGNNGCVRVVSINNYTLAELCSLPSPVRQYSSDTLTPLYLLYEVMAL